MLSRKGADYIYPMKRLFFLSILFCAVFNFSCVKAQVQQDNLQEQNIFSADAFALVNKGSAVTIYVDSTDAQVVTVAAKAFQQDITMITSVKSSLSFNQKNINSLPVIIGTVNNMQ